MLWKVGCDLVQRKQFTVHVFNTLLVLDGHGFGSGMNPQRPRQNLLATAQVPHSTLGAFNAVHEEGSPGLMESETSARVGRVGRVRLGLLFFLLIGSVGGHFSFEWKLCLLCVCVWVLCGATLEWGKEFVCAAAAGS